MDENQSPMFEDDSADQAKTWIQENLRIIVSVFIVAAIALGIYSYSERTQMAANDNGMLETQGTDNGATTGNDSVKGNDTQNMVQSDMNKDSHTGMQMEMSQETETSFVEKAQHGDGSTHLARRALAHYLEKNPDSALSGEHKVYIEDYLRKNVNFKGHVTDKTSIEFSKDLIKQAIEKSKHLNDHQLQNLKKYSSRVSAYR